MALTADDLKDVESALAKAQAKAGHADRVAKAAVHDLEEALKAGNDAGLTSDSLKEAEAVLNVARSNVFHTDAILQAIKAAVERVSW